jgi:hypothetical protein
MNDAYPSEYDAYRPPTQATAEGDVVAEGPVEVMEDSFGGVSVSSYLIVDEGAESVDRLELELDDGPGLAVQREEEVMLELDVPPPGTLDPKATISWSTSSGTAEARWLMGSAGLDGDGDPEVYGATGTATFGSPSLPAEGGWLVVVASDGLAFDLVLVGPYHASEATGSPVEWRVFLEGEEVEDGDTLRVPLADETWYARADVWVLPPGGGDVDPADIDATWTSDRQGDLSDINMQDAPTVWLYTEDLVEGAHTWTLHLEAPLPRGGTATHELHLDVTVE